MDLGLKGKVAIITGTGSQNGFGKGIALTLAREGCDIVSADIDIEGAEQTAAEVEALGRKTLTIKVDVCQKKEVEAMVKQALDKFSQIDIMVNNAGIASPMRPFVDTSEKDWDLNINVNYKGTLYGTYAVLPHMLKRGYGKIINISSMAAFAYPGGSGGTSTYAAAKAAVLVFSKAIMSEVKNSGININVVAPSGGDTGFAEASQASPELRKRIKEMAATGQLTTPQDVGNTVLFFASDISKRINGQVLIV